MGVFFKDIIGHKGVIGQLKRCVDENSLAHALLITGPRGNGKLAIAIALANYILCSKRSSDVCGACPTCVKLNKFIHSDLHFVFPVKNKKGSCWQKVHISVMTTGCENSTWKTSNH